jgi:multidrug efflux pump subunit AcrA (membrane-fusion protein)
MLKIISMLKKGQLLVELDPRDYKVAVEQAEAAYARAKGEISAQSPNVPITETSNTTLLATACIILFTFASFLCGSATSMGMIVAARAIQGAAGGALQPLSQAMLLESFPPVKRGQAMSVFGLGVVVAPILGPTPKGQVAAH